MAFSQPRYSYLLGSPRLPFSKDSSVPESGNLWSFVSVSVIILRLANGLWRVTHVHCDETAIRALPSHQRASFCMRVELKLRRRVFLADVCVFAWLMAFAKLIFHFVLAFGECLLGTKSNVTTADKDYSVYCFHSIYHSAVFGGFVWPRVYPGQVSLGYVSFCLSSWLPVKNKCLFLLLLCLNIQYVL